MDQTEETVLIIVVTLTISSNLLISCYVLPKLICYQPLKDYETPKILLTFRICLFISSIIGLFMSLAMISELYDNPWLNASHIQFFQSLQEQIGNACALLIIQALLASIHKLNISDIQIRIRRIPVILVCICPCYVDHE